MDAPISSPVRARNNSSAASSQQSPDAPTAPSNDGTSTQAYLQDFTLLAEAAKRAQVAVLVRDFEDIGL